MKAGENIYSTPENVSFESHVIFGEIYSSFSQEMTISGESREYAYVQAVSQEVYIL